MTNRIEKNFFTAGNNLPNSESSAEINADKSAEAIKSVKLFEAEAFQTYAKSDSPSTFGSKISEPAGDAISISTTSEVKPEEALSETQNTKNSAPVKYQPVNIKYNANTPFVPEKAPQIDEDVFNSALNEVIDKWAKNSGKKQKQSVLKNKGRYFVREAKSAARTKPSDPFLLAGISLHESTCGTSPMATDGRCNIAGLKNQRYSSVEKCITKLAGLIDSRVFDNNLTTVTKLANSGKYCAKTAAPVWTKATCRFATDLQNKYNELLAKKYGEK